MSQVVVHVHIIFACYVTCITWSSIINTFHSCVLVLIFIKPQHSLSVWPTTTSWVGQANRHSVTLNASIQTSSAPQAERLIESRTTRLALAIFFVLTINYALFNLTMCHSLPHFSIMSDARSAAACKQCLKLFSYIICPD